MKQKLLLIVADSILIIHVAFVIYIVFGLLTIYVGHLLKWSWIRNFWFRISHLIAIGIVVFQSWVGMICPLTIWEMSLRKEAGDVTYSGSFIQHWLQSILYYSAPEWVFVLSYTAFGCLVLASWFIVKPIKRTSK
jgi:glucan phosphoethanolaminetransferase (alkaline phosphatase superfamily)